MAITFIRWHNPCKQSCQQQLSISSQVDWILPAHTRARRGLWSDRLAGQLAGRAAASQPLGPDWLGDRGQPGPRPSGQTGRQAEPSKSMKMKTMNISTSHSAHCAWEWTSHSLDGTTRASRIASNAFRQTAGIISGLCQLKRNCERRLSTNSEHDTWTMPAHTLAEQVYASAHGKKQCDCEPDCLLPSNQHNSSIGEHTETVRNLCETMVWDLVRNRGN